MLALARVFCIVFEAGSVSAAAEALALTQPAVSHSLARLRATLSDPLFVRVGRRLQPTSLATELYPSFRDALLLLNRAVQSALHFDAACAVRRFHIAMSDIGEQVFLPPILVRLQREAPSVAITVRQIPISALSRAMETGQVDMALGNLPGLLDTRFEKLFVEEYVCLMRVAHPLLRPSQTRLSLAAFAAASHVFVASPFSGHSLIETALVRRGVSRRIALEVPHFTSVPGIIEATDLIVTVPSRIATLFSQTHALASRGLPVHIAPFVVRMHWHGRSDGDRGHEWLRGMVLEELRGL